MSQRNLFEFGIGSNSESVCKTPTTKRTLDLNDSAPNTLKRAKEEHMTYYSAVYT
ncbi:hypothetical protein DPMN_062797 [Dreissena polymorpha]|uniref:Uncharacterized protein n=1 Tax=Dreissena polymorpha TaxID=45954 RepID=A0A9D4HJN1_DREPO|nr:hypothetical protein DPMN_062797 [Dreissena polymorpha]